MKYVVWLAVYLAGLFFLPVANSVELDEYLLDLPPEARSSVWLEYSSGLEDSQDASINLDISLNQQHRLLLGYGQSDLSAASGRYNTYSLTAGYHSAYGQDFEFGVIYDFWGNTDALWTHAINVPLRWNTPDWTFAVAPKYTWINLYRNVNQRNTQVLVETSSRTLELSAGYYGLRNWDFTLRGQRDWYEGDLTRLNQPIAEIFFSDLALVLSYGFPESRLAVEAAYHFPKVRIGVEQEQTISAVDKSELNITTLKTAFYYSNNVTWYLDGGHIAFNNSDVEASNFVRLAMQWHY